MKKFGYFNTKIINVDSRQFDVGYREFPIDDEYNLDAIELMDIFEIDDQGNWIERSIQQFDSRVIKSYILREL